MWKKIQINITSPTCQCPIHLVLIDFVEACISVWIFYIIIISLLINALIQTHHTHTHTHTHTHDMTWPEGDGEVRWGEGGGGCGERYSKRYLNVSEFLNATRFPCTRQPRSRVCWLFNQRSPDLQSEHTALIRPVHRLARSQDQPSLSG